MGTTADKLQAILNSKADIKNAIEEKGQEVGSLPLSDYADKIRAIEAGNGEEDYFKNDVIFIDYDGKILYDYSKTDFLALTEMPADPSHSGLTAQGWNWTLAEAKNYVTSYGRLTIGQMYITDDGKTRIYITLDDPNFLSPVLHLKVSNTTVIIDWGDNSEEDTLTYNGNTDIAHTYTTIGDYVVKISFSSGTSRLGYDNGVSYRFGCFSSNDAYVAHYKDKVKKVEIGSKVALPNYTAFVGCHNLETVTVPSGCTIGHYAFAYTSLKALVHPRGVANAGYCELESVESCKIVSWAGNANTTYLASSFSNSGLVRFEMPLTNVTSNAGTFSRCRNLKEITNLDYMSTVQDCLNNTNLEKVVFGNVATTFKTSALRYCPHLKYVSLGNAVATIEAYCFRDCYGLEEFHIKSTSPPSIQTTSLPPVSYGFRLFVPRGYLQTYKTATNWSTWADLMEEENE